MGIGNEDIGEESPYTIDELLEDRRNELCNNVNLSLIALEESEKDVIDSEARVAKAQKELAAFDKWTYDHGIAINRHQ